VHAAAPQAQSDRGLDRRSFLRRSGLVAGSLATLGALPLANLRKADAGPPPPAGEGPERFPGLFLSLDRDTDDVTNGARTKAIARHDETQCVIREW
jgi:hypothetical protein